MGTNVVDVPALPVLVDELFQRPADEGVTLAAVRDRLLAMGARQVLTAVFADKDYLVPIVAESNGELVWAGDEPQLGGGVGDAAREEQVVEHEQVGLDVGAQQRGLFVGAAHGVAGELGVGLDVAHVEALQRGLVGHGLGDMALAGAGLADDQRVGALADELQGVQLEAGAARQLRIETPVEVGQRGALVQARALEAALGQARATPVELVLEHGGEGLQKRLLGGLGLHHAGGQRLGDAREAQLAQGAFDLDHVHG